MKAEPFRPDHEPYMQRFAQVYPGIPDLVDLFDRPHFEPKPQVFTAWTTWQASGAGERMRPLGAHAFYERFVRALDDTQAGLERVVADFSDYPKEVEPIDEIGSCNDPFRLISMFSGGRFGLDYEATELGRFEIARKLAIASQLLCISAADPYERVTGDLTDVNLLVNSRLYEQNVRHVIVHYILLGATGHNRLDDRQPIQVTFEDDLVRPRDDNRGVRQLRFRCRLVKNGDTTYYVYTSSRPKERISGIFRLERGGTLTDRRGLTHVVVAVERNGQVQAADRSAAEAFADIARERLWREPLQEESDMSPPNVTSHRDFWATKIVGRLFSRSGYPMAAPVEHQITSIGDRLNMENASDGLGHKQYKRRVIRQHILPLWFPLERYNIDWAVENGRVK